METMVILLAATTLGAFGCYRLERRWRIEAQAELAAVLRQWRAVAGELDEAMRELNAVCGAEIGAPVWPHELTAQNAYKARGDACGS